MEENRSYWGSWGKWLWIRWWWNWRYGEKVRSFLENKIQKKDYSDYKCKLCKYGVNSKILLKVHMTTELGMAYNPAI